MRISFLLRRGLCAAAALAAAPACLAAQGRVPALRLGNAVEGAISAGDPALMGYRFRAYRLDATPDKLYRLTLLSPGGLARMQVVQQAGVLTASVAETYPGDTVRYRFQPPGPGQYLVVVSADTAWADSSVAFTLVADEIRGEPPVPRPIAMGEIVRGEVSDRSGLMPDGAGFYELHTYRVTAGQQIGMVRYTYGDSVTFGRMRDGRFEVIAADTTQPPGTLRISQDGEYALRVHAQIGESAMPYVLRLVDLAARPEPRRLETGQPATGFFDALRAYPFSDAPADEWIVRGTAGRRLTVSAVSDSFDIYVVVGRRGEDGWTEITSDDDGGGETNALAVVDTLPETGEYVIHIRPYGAVPAPDEGGAYTLLVREEVPRPPVSRRERPQRARMGRAVEPGVLDEADALLEDGTPYEEWTFSATEGQRVTITMHSDTLDAYLAVGVTEGGAFQLLGSNDDYVGGNGRDARIVMVAPAAGEYVIRVNTAVPDQAGPYTLRVERGR